MFIRYIYVPTVPESWYIWCTYMYQPSLGKVSGLGLLSGLGPAIRRTGTPRHAGWYTRAETSGWHFRRRSVPDLALKVRHYWNLAPALAANQHHPRLLAPSRQLGCRQDQRLLPWRVKAPSCPRVIVRVSQHRAPSVSIPEENCKPGVRLSAWHTAPPDVSLRSDHPYGYPRGIRHRHGARYA